MPGAGRVILIGRGADISDWRVKRRRAGSRFWGKQIGLPRELLAHWPHGDISLNLCGMSEGRAGMLARAAKRVLFDPVFPNGGRALTAGNEPRRAGHKKAERAFSHRSRNTLDFHSFIALRCLGTMHRFRMGDGFWIGPRSKKKQRFAQGSNAPGIPIGVRGFYLEHLSKSLSYSLRRRGPLRGVAILGLY